MNNTALMTPILESNVSIVLARSLAKTVSNQTVSLCLRYHFGFPIPGTNRELIHQFAFHRKAKPGVCGNLDRSTGADFNLGLNDVFTPVALAGGNVSGQSEIRQCGHCDVVSASNARLQHATAPHRQ